MSQVKGYYPKYVNNSKIEGTKDQNPIFKKARDRNGHSAKKYL